MGMFDSVYIEYELPEEYAFLQDMEFQTKDFEKLMDKYVITKDGRLLKKEYRWDIIPEEERPYYGTEEWNKNPIYKLIGSMRSVPQKSTDMDFHGVFNFYTAVERPEDKCAYDFYDMQAKFTDGKLVDLKIEKSG